MVRKCKSCQGFIKGYQRSYGIGKCGNTPLENQITWNNEDCMAEACKKPRNISTWVMCDKCERWFHLVCVGIIYSKEELEHMEWKCSDCGERKEEGGEEHHSPEVLKQHREERINPLLRFTRETVQVRRVSVLEKAQRETVQVPRVSLLVEAQRVQHTNLLNSSKLTFLQYPVQNETPSRLSPPPTTHTTTQ